MKTNRLAGISMLVAILILASCSTVKYRVETRIGKNGSAERTIYALGDSAFLAGDLSHNPFPFEIDSSWKIIFLDSVEQTPFIGRDIKTNVKTSRKARHVADYSLTENADETGYLLVTPRESLQKKFKWFYTHYRFEAVYENIADEIPVPASRYFDADEQKMWFQGDFSAYSGMNGYELKSDLDDMEEKFYKWYNANLYEKSFEVILYFAENEFVSKLKENKNALFNESIKNKDITKVDFDPEDLCKILDNYFETAYFSDLYADKKQEMKNLFDKNTTKLLEIFETALRYDLSLPGNIVSANTNIRENGILSWKVDALRFAADDYILTAESRTVNIWAFAATGLLALLSIVCLAKVFGRKY